MPQDSDSNSSIIAQRRVRRKHKNSKNGCGNCKMRKIKCDEGLPSCINCDRKELDCPYLTMTPFQIHMIMTAHNEETGESKLLFSDLGNTYSEYPSRHPINLQRNTSIISPTDLIADTVSPLKTDETSVSELNAQLGSTALNESVYQATDLEHILLKHEKGLADTCVDPSSSSEYIPIKSNFATIDNTNGDSLLDDFNFDQHQLNIDNSGALSSKSETVFKSFKVNRKLEYSIGTPVFEKMTDVLTAVHTMDFPKLFMKYGVLDLDSELQKNFFRMLIMCAPFSKLTSKSLLLYSTDFLKNTIIRQPILSRDKFNIKMGISCSCENYSVHEIGVITNVINYEYLANYHLFDVSVMEILMGCFVVLNYCLVYHFKSGVSTELSVQEGKNCVSKFGIFNAGLFSIAMDRNEFVQNMVGVDILSKHLIWNLKTMLKPSLRYELIDDLKKKVERLSTKIQSDSQYYTHYENLKLFLEKHAPLIKEHTSHSQTFLGVREDNGYVIRLMNEFYQVIPFDLSNLIPGPLISDEMIIIYLSFITTANLLSNILPGALAFATNDFSGRGWHICLFMKTEVLMLLFKQIANDDFKELAIYLIRIITILKRREEEYTKFFTLNSFEELTSPDLGIDTFERCRRLKDIKRMGIMSETIVKSFKFDRGEFFQPWNVPHVSDSVAIENATTPVKINAVLPTLEEKVEDFITSNNGLFSMDFEEEVDPMVRLAEMRSIATDANRETPSSVSMAWRVSVQIRMNNS